MKYLLILFIFVFSVKLSASEPFRIPFYVTMNSIEQISNFAFNNFKNKNTKIKKLEFMQIDNYQNNIWENNYKTEYVYDRSNNLISESLLSLKDLKPLFDYKLIYNNYNDNIDSAVFLFSHQTIFFDDTTIVNKVFIKYNYKLDSNIFEAYCENYDFGYNIDFIIKYFYDENFNIKRKQIFVHDKDENKTYTFIDLKRTINGTKIISDSSVIDESLLSYGEEDKYLQVISYEYFETKIKSAILRHYHNKKIHYLETQEYNYDNYGNINEILLSSSTSPDKNLLLNEQDDIDKIIYVNYFKNKKMTDYYFPEYIVQRYYSDGLTDYLFMNYPEFKKGNLFKSVHFLYLKYGYDPLELSLREFFNYTDLNNTPINDKIEIHPIDVHENIFIRLNTKLNPRISLIIGDSKGNIKLKIKTNKLKNDYFINVSKLKKGEYFIKYGNILKKFYKM